MSYYSKYIKHVFYSIAGLIPNKIIHLTSPRIILPTYHAVTDHIPDHLKHLYKPKNRQQFVKDLDFLLKEYQPIELNELVRLIHSKEKISKNLFHISFDDGLRECYEIIVPILKEKGIPATFFINPDFVDNKNLMFRHKASLLINEIIKKNNKKNSKLLLSIKKCTYPYKDKIEQWADDLGYNFEKYLKTHQPYMKTEEIKEIIVKGFTIGAHSMDHPEFSHISFEEQILQTQNSVNYVRKNFPSERRVFAFPFNDDFVSKKYFDMILGENKIADLTFAIAGIKRDYHPHHMQRIPMEKKFSGKNIVKGEHLYYLAKKIVNKNKITRY